MHILSRVPRIPSPPFHTPSPPPNCRRVWFEEQQGRAKQKEEEEEARRKKARARFDSLLRHAREVRLDTKWEEFAAVYEKDRDFKEVGGLGWGKGGRGACHAVCLGGLAGKGGGLLVRLLWSALLGGWLC